MKQIEITARRGKIDYWENLGKYTISYSIPNTIDSMVTCLVPDPEMIPIGYRSPGINVIFSATVIDESHELPQPALGGQVIYLITQIHSIHSV